MAMRVLVVEDEFVMRILLEEILSDNGYEFAGSVSTVEEAIKQIPNLSCDAVILDVNLNGAKTFHIADMLIEKGIPFLFSTGYAISSIPDKYQAYPALQKPYNIHEIETNLKLLSNKLPIKTL